MAEETDLSRTEPASPKRLREARAAGDVPRSAEFAGWVVLMAAVGVLGWQGAGLLAAAQDVMRTAFGQAATPSVFLLSHSLEPLFWSLLPVLAAIFVAALVAPMVLSGPVFAPKFARPDLARTDPFKPFARLFSVEGIVDGVLALFKLALVGAAVAWTFSAAWPDLGGLTADVSAPLPALVAWVGQGVVALVAALVVLAVLDGGWRWWRYLRRHAMTWQEVLAEAREGEGSPEMRAQLRARQQQAGQGRRIDEVIG